MKETGKGEKESRAETGRGPALLLLIIIFIRATYAPIARLIYDRVEVSAYRDVAASVEDVAPETGKRRARWNEPGGRLFAVNFGTESMNDGTLLRARIGNSVWFDYSKGNLIVSKVNYL